MTVASATASASPLRVLADDPLGLSTMPSSLSKLSTSLEGIGHVLRDKPLGVPAYQRSYAWGVEQVETFWWDLRSVLDSKRPDYFLGTIVYTAANGKGATVIDGQQRLATTMMLFTVVRDEFLSRGDKYRAAVVEGDYIASRELRSAELIPRVTLNAEDDEFFRSWVLAHPGQRAEVDDLPASNRRLKHALELLRGLLSDQLAAAGPTWEDTLVQWIDLLEYQARVIAVEVSDDADAFLIFETLNDRGLDLTVADLLKNYLFGLARDDVSEVQAAWVSVLETLETSATEETLTMFLRHYWSSLYGATRERELYSRLKSQIRTPAAALSFMEALDEAAPFYAALLNSSHPAWEQWEGLQAEAETFLRLGLERNRPMVLAAMQKFEIAEFRLFLRALIGWLVRGLIAGGLAEGGVAERRFAEIGTRINAGELTDTAGVFEDLSPLIASDREFIDSFRSARVNRTHLARYLLAAMARAENGAAEPGLISDAEQDEWVLHLGLPRRAQLGLWPGFPEEEIGPFANRLGNQFVLPRSTSLPEDPVERSVVIASSGSPVTASVERWSADAVQERQDQMAEMAVSIWPLMPA
jgi:uncharacterized protein DUF262